MSIPAFPRPFSKDDTEAFDTSPTYNAHVGMSLRDYFAAKAIQGLLNNGMHPNVYELARDAYKLADAMIEAR